MNCSGHGRGEAPIKHDRSRQSSGSFLAGRGSPSLQCGVVHVHIVIGIKGRLSFGHIRAPFLQVEDLEPRAITNAVFRAAGTC